MADEKPIKDSPTSTPTPPAQAPPAQPAPPQQTPAQTPAPTPQPQEAPQQAEIKPKKKLPHSLTGIKLFGKYDSSEVVVHDAGLLKYINLDPVITPHSGGRHANRWFGKARLNIVERLVNGMMRTEDFTGKKIKAYNVVREAFAIIAEKTKTNPIQIFVNALEKVSPREEVTRLKYGGISVPKAVDISSSRRLDVALRNICTGAVQSTYKSTKPVEECLANEIMLAAKGDMTSFALSKKEELERVAASAR